MTATAAPHAATAPKTPPLPEAKPETLGLSRPRLQAMSEAFKREIDKGTVPGVTVLVARRGQVGWFEALGKQSPAGAAPMAHEFDLPDLFDDQADRVGRHHGAGRGRPPAPQRRRRKIHPRILRPEGRAGQRRQAGAGSAQAADDGAGPAPPHLRLNVRAPGRRPRAQDLPGLAGTQPQDHQCRARRAGGELPPGLPSRRRVQLQPLHRHPRPHHRGHQRQIARGLPYRPHPRAAPDDGYRFLDG